MLQNTELLKVTVEDLDGQPAEQPPPVNILREKTFNPELSSLLNKIYSHEKTAETGTAEAEEIDPVQKIELLQKCDRLLYKLKHEAEASSVSSMFNPFFSDINVYDDIDDLDDYIETGLKQIGLSRFLILKYNFKDGAFRTELNRIDESLTSDLFFSTKDPLFLQMYENNKGFILNHENVKNDFFLNKKLGNLFNSRNDEDVIYFTRVYSLLNDDCISLKVKESMSTFDRFLCPVIAVIPDSGKHLSSGAVISEMLRDNMQIPLTLYIMKNRIDFDSTAFSYEETLLMLELLMSSPSIKDMTRSVIILDDFSVKENMFIFKLLLSRIKKRLEKNSLFMRLGIDKCILITSEREKKDISGMIDEINSDDKIISLVPVDAGTVSSGESLTSLFL